MSKSGTLHPQKSPTTEGEEEGGEQPHSSCSKTMENVTEVQTTPEARTVEAKGHFSHVLSYQRLSHVLQNSLKAILQPEQTQTPWDRVLLMITNKTTLNRIIMIQVHWLLVKWRKLKC
ncbi:hypothetical protein P7K49_008394 [Saguinus oedipus]|uniref:Uncharacterized protein n=1 Tax=Saguinus oedipus TaxID=9490 RepID=A0ABQ9VZX5_SAGOE|nr:hypothetical protein P7K49_008394 [Saguinus oedipus]